MEGSSWPGASTGEPKTLLYLVTGGSGFIGRKLVEALKRGGQRVRVLDRKECKPTERVEGVEYMVGDVCDLASRSCYWACERVDVVFHCARLSDPMADYNAHHDINVKGTENVLNAALEQGVKALVYTSSVAVIVDGSDINGGDESMPYPDKHLDHASATKALAEKLVVECNGRVNHRGSGELYTCCIRPEMVFGPGDNHFVPQLLDKAREGEITHMIGDGSNLVDFTYVDNVVLAHLLASEHLVEGSPALGQVYFITNGEARPFWDFLTAIFDGMGYPPPTKAIGQRLAYGTAFVLEKAGGMLKYFMNFRPKLTRQLVFNMSMNHYFSHAKATKEIGYTPVVSLDLGIERTMDWIRSSHYSPDIGIYDRWAKVRAAISPERPPVLVPLSSRHSSASSVASLEAMGRPMEGMAVGGEYPMGGVASPPRWYDLPEGAMAAPPPEWAGSRMPPPPDGRMSPKGSEQNLRGSFCASIPEENEVGHDLDIQHGPPHAKDLAWGDSDEEDGAPQLHVVGAPSIHVG